MRDDSVQRDMPEIEADTREKIAKGEMPKPQWGKHLKNEKGEITITYRKLVIRENK